VINAWATPMGVLPLGINRITKGSEFQIEETPTENGLFCISGC